MAVIDDATEYTTHDRKLASQLPDTGQPRLVVIGGGFGGIQLLKNFNLKNVQVVMIDRHNYHTFQPLLYQVATAGLEPDSIAAPLRKVFEDRKNFFFRMAKVESISPDEMMINTNIGRIRYDFLVISTGTHTNYFGNEKIRNLAFPLKQVPQALNLRSQILQNFEKAVTSDDPEEIDRLTNFVVVGGGPTGVELAGALGELKKYVLPRDYPDLDFKTMKVFLVEGLDRLLPPMSEESGRRALKDLEERFETNVLLNTMVEDYDGYEVTLSTGEKIIAETLIWAAGVTGRIVKGLDKAKTEKSRYVVDNYSRVKGYTDIFAIGDIAYMECEAYPKGHPQVAPVAMQQGERLAKNLKALFEDKALKPFDYFDKGTMATIGRNRAVADLPNGMKFWGLPAWLAWMFIHLLYLVSFRQKLITLGNWTWNYFTYDRGTRLIIRPFNYRKAVAEKKSYFDQDEEVTGQKEGEAKEAEEGSWSS